MRWDELARAIDTASSLLAWEEVEWAVTFNECGEPVALVEGTEHSVTPVSGYLVFHNHPQWATAWPSVDDVVSFVWSYRLDGARYDGVLSGDGRQYFLMWVADPDALANHFDDHSRREWSIPASPGLLRSLGLSWEVGTWVGGCWETIHEAPPVHILL